MMHPAVVLIRRSAKGKTGVCSSLFFFLNDGMVCLRMRKALSLHYCSFGRFRMLRAVDDKIVSQVVYLPDGSNT